MNPQSHGEQGELMPLFDAVPDPRQMSVENRQALLDMTYDAVVFANGGRYTLSAGPEADLMWDATLRCFVHGIWAGSIMCAQAVCERTLASLMESWYATQAEPKGWRRWGLGQLIEHHRKHELVNSALLDQAQIVCDARKPFGHWRMPMGEGSLERIGYDSFVAGKDWSDAQLIYVAKSALLCSQIAARVHHGDLWMNLPSRSSNT